MNKEELVQVVAMRAKLAPEEAQKLVEAFTDAVSEELEKGNKVSLSGFGSFELRRHRARETVNPRTGKKMKIPALTVVRFKPSKDLKKALSLI